MQITVRCVGSAVVVGLEGRLTAATSPAQLHRLVGQLARSRGSVIVLDLERVERLDCAGIGELILLNNGVSAAGGELRLANLGPLQRQMLEMLRLTEPLSVCASMRQALRGCARSREARSFDYRFALSLARRGANVRGQVNVATGAGGAKW